MSEERRKGFELRGWHVLVGMLAVLVVLFILFRVFSHSALERKIAELRAKGYPTTIDELEKYNQLPNGIPNAADLYVKAFNAYRVPTEAEKMLLPYVGSLVLKPGESIPPASKTATEAFLARNTKTIELLRHAGQIEQCRYSSSRLSNGGLWNPYYAEMKTCFKLLSLWIFEKAEAGNSQEVIRGIVDQIRFSESLKQDPYLVSYLSRLTFHALNYDVLQDIFFVQLELNDQQMIELQMELFKVRNDLQISQAIIGERCFHIVSYKTKDPYFGAKPARLLGVMGINTMRVLDHEDQLEKIGGLDPEYRFKEYQRVEEEIKSWSLLYFRAKMLIPAKSTMGRIELRVIGELDCARAALGVERYRLAQRRLPGLLQELVPKYLEKVPIDPFDGKPLRYKRLEKGYTIYSIGEDGEDNGGVPKDKVPKGANYDWPFTVER